MRTIEQESMEKDPSLPAIAPPEVQKASPRDLVIIAVLPAIAALVIAGVSARYGVVQRFATALSNAPSIVAALCMLALLTPVVTLVVVWRRFRAEHSAHVKLTELARLDTLTGLPNRFGLTAQLEAAMQSSRTSGMPFAVLFVDLDRFKVVNDTFGHEVGDALMRAAATRLRHALRPIDQVVRYGGDEFVVICPDVTNVGTGERIAQRVISSIEEPFTIGRQSLSISSSIGIALADHHVAEVEQVVRDADVAMYQAKGAGPGAYRVFDRTIGGALTPSAVEDRLRRATERREFRVFYQPVVDTATGHIVGVEALLRWHDSERGLVAPDEFLPILEETGLIVPVGAWVLAEACRQAVEWRRIYPQHPLELKVNVSARQLSQVDFGDMIIDVLQESGLPASAVFLEITESALMDDVSSAWATLREAKTRGVRLALDDFGTGFSSLSYIRRFSLDMLKIDKSFVDGLAHEPDDVAIVEHVIGLAKALGMVTVAEGVEQPEQLRQLQRLGCERAQGFWFSPPVPPELIGPMLSDTTLATRWSDVRPAAPVTPPNIDGDGGAKTSVTPVVVGMLRDIPRAHDPSSLTLPPMPEQQQLDLESTEDTIDAETAPHDEKLPEPAFTPPVALEPPPRPITLPPMFRSASTQEPLSPPLPSLRPPAAPTHPVSSSPTLERALPIQFSAPRPVPAASLAPRQARVEASRDVPAAMPPRPPVLSVPPSPAPRGTVGASTEAAAPDTATSQQPGTPTPERPNPDSPSKRVAPPPPAPRGGHSEPKRPARVPMSLPSMQEVTADGAGQISPGAG